MVTLIGAGGHAADIAAVAEHDGSIDVQIDHHSVWDGRGEVIIGINDPRLRSKVADELDVVDLFWVHPDARLSPTVTVEYGVHINYGVTATRTLIGRHTTISPGVTICGDVAIGERVLIGAGVTICDRVNIGDDVTIGAGAVVLPETFIPAGETWVGVPARKVEQP